MPTTRAGSAQSKAASEATSDWSLNTPSDAATTTDTSIPAPSIVTRRTPPPCVRAWLPPARITEEPAGFGSTPGEASCTTPRTSTNEDAEEIDPTQRSPTRSNQDRSVVVKPHPSHGSAPTSSREGSLQPSRPKNTQRVDIQPTRQSQRRKAEAQAKLTLALREMELAEARSRLAQAELQLLATGSDEEDGAREDIYERTREVEDWCIQAEQPTKPKSDIQELASVIMKLAEKPREVSSKNYELPQFNGACEEWLAFKRTYEDMAASFSNAQNLARLRSAIQGKAREAVQSLLFIAEDPLEIMKGLESRFGRPGALALSELEKLKNLSKIGENPTDICIFASKVSNAVETIKALKKQQYLSSPETMKSLIEKMPTSMKFRWYTYYRSRRDEEVQELILIDAFLQVEADMCGDFAPPEVSSEQKKVLRKPVHTIQEASTGKFKKVCPICEEEHFILECKKFKEAELNEKWDLTKRSRLCFKCLKFKHSRVNCKAPVCKKCKRWHHTVLHSDDPPTPVNKEIKGSTATEEKVASS